MNKQIIHFEDDQLLGELYKSKFQEAGFNNFKHYLNPPNNEAELIELILTEKPDLIIMGIIMPVMGGFEATTILRANEKTKNIPIIGLDNLSQPQDIKRAKEVGMVDYFIMASITPDKFVEKIKEFLMHNK